MLITRRHGLQFHPFWMKMRPNTWDLNSKDRREMVDIVLIMSKTKRRKMMTVALKGRGFMKTNHYV
jgi:hypothetical protein